MRLIKLLPATICLMGLLAAQAPDLPPGPPGEPDGNRMEMMAIWRLTEHLALTPDQAKAFFPVLQAHREKMRELNDQRQKLERDIVDKAERGETIADKEFKSVLTQLTDLEKQRVDLKIKYLNDLEGVLTNVQRIKLMVFDERFKNELRQDVKERRDAMERNRSLMGRFGPDRDKE